MKKVYLLCIVILSLLIAVQLASAIAPFRVSYDAIKEKISWGEEAKFVLKITNNQNFDDTFSIYYPDILWSVSAVPRESNPVNVKQNSTGEMIISITPLYIEQLGDYIVPVNIKSTATNGMIQLNLKVSMQSPEDLASFYLPSVKVFVEIPNEVNPADGLSIKVKLQNRNYLNFTNIRVYLSSKFINEEQNTSLGPLHSAGEESILTFKKEIDPKTEPLNDKVVIDIYKGDLKIGSIEKAYSIIAYSNVIMDESKSYDKKGFMSYVRDYTYYNKGNVISNKTIKIESTFWQSIFTSTRPRADRIKENGIRYLAWNIKIAPYSEARVRASTNYKTIIYAVIIAILWIIFYFKYRSPIVVKKSVASIHTRDGGISKLKIVLLVKNRSNVRHEEISLSDRLPKIVEVVEDETHSVYPSKIIEEENKVTLIRWNINEMEALEERIITYVVRTRLSVLGDFELPTAVVRFKTKKGFYKKVMSNSVMVRS